MTAGTFNFQNYDSSPANQTALRGLFDSVTAALTAAGWVQTTDTGQLASNAAIGVGADHSSAGYQIWRMNDALHTAGNPVYMKLEYCYDGWAHWQTATLAVTLGFSTNGAGTLTGTTTARKVLKVFNSWNGAGLGASDPNGKAFWSGANNRFLLSAPEDATNNYGNSFFINIERTHDADGTDNADGVMAMFGDGVTDGSRWQYTTVVALKALAISSVRSNPTAVSADERLLTSGGDYFYIPWLVPSKRGMENPMKNVAVQYIGNFAEANLATVQSYNEAIHYRTPISYPGRPGGRVALENAMTLDQGVASVAAQYGVAQLTYRYD